MFVRTVLYQLQKCFHFSVLTRLLLLFSRSVVSNSLRPRGLEPTKLLCPWDISGKKSGVGCHSLLQEIFPTQGSNPHELLGSLVFTIMLNHVNYANSLGNPGFGLLAVLILHLEALHCFSIFYVSSQLLTFASQPCSLINSNWSTPELRQCLGCSQTFHIPVLSPQSPPSKAVPVGLVHALTSS